jgi:hypothetical protein
MVHGRITLKTNAAELTTNADLQRRDLDAGTKAGSVR